MEKNQTNNDLWLALGGSLIGGFFVYWLIKRKLNEKEQKLIQSKQEAEQRSSEVQELKQQSIKQVEEFKQEKQLFKQKSNEREEKIRLLFKKMKQRKLVF